MGSLDESLPHINEEGKLALRTDYDSNPGLPKDQLTRVVEFNDLKAAERELAHMERCSSSVGTGNDKLRHGFFLRKVIWKV